MALTITRLGMSLMRMGKSAENVRFLDDVDLTFSMDSRSSSSQQMMNMEIVAKPIVFRASYRDIRMITSIVNKAIDLYGSSHKSGANDGPVVMTNSKSVTPQFGRSRTQPVGKARVLMSKEQAS